MDTDNILSKISKIISENEDMAKKIKRLIKDYEKSSKLTPKQKAIRKYQQSEKYKEYKRQYYQRKKNENSCN
jgi:hypothetical protein